ncbi:MAG: ATP-binding protein, partial [Bacteroidota bacterium]
VDISAEKPRLVKSLPFDPGARLSNGREVMEDPDGNFWFAYENNNVLIFNAELKLERTLENIPGNKEEDVNCIHRDKDGGVWFGTTNLGLIRLTPDGRTVRIGKAEGLLSNRISHIVEGADRTLWIATWHGLAFVKYSSRQIYLADSMPGLPNKFGDHEGAFKIDGNREVAQCPIWSLGVFPDGAGWVATNFEVVFHKRRATRQPFQPPVLLQKLTVNGKEHSLENALRLAAGENDLVFDFGTVCLQSRTDIRFRHKLERNGDGDWSAPNALESVNFAGLKSGSYTFWVEALGVDELKSPAPARFSFTIVPPVWQRWWFLAACLAVVGAGAWFFIRLRIRRLLEIERIRSRIAADLHDDIGSGLTRIALASDMLLRQKTEVANPAQNALFQRIGSNARELLEAMSDIVWAIDPANDSLGRAADRIRIFANDVCEAQGIECRFEFDRAAAALKPGSGVVSSLVLIAKEAVNNAVRHARCGVLIVGIKTSGHELRLVVQDDGAGFDEEKLSRINGLTNMRRRGEKAGGRVEIETAAGGGTRVEAVMRLG